MIAIGKPFVDTLVENHITIREYFIIYCYVYDKVHLLRDYNAVQRAKVEDVTNLVKNKEFLQIKNPTVSTPVVVSIHFRRLSVPLLLPFLQYA